MIEDEHYPDNANGKELMEYAARLVEEINKDVITKEEKY